ncbi:U3 small nucleolar RNA-interacting protein 2-like [Tripterygium wilfordii]|uniref:U3 small nucleolar RNA-interacting protein 2-like n=1 Tax=Tripterygium wilfordii TaxID=458696 RepID=A0A7J7E1U3_TRIWF|nr:U3 snoRNP-associated protein-like EMB2271 [Tripterygium wilfordii]KAF5752565.1 U3 small nucleolar RNA-interacting protein 2-like [Tripterygium wilfordii]
MALKNKNSKKKDTGPKGRNKMGKRFSMEEDPLFSAEPEKRRKIDFKDDDIESEDDSEILGSDIGEEDGDLAADEEENADEKRHRLAAELVEKYRAAERRKKEEEDEYEDGRGTEKEGERDTLVAQILMQEQLEESGRVRRVIASRVQKPEAVDGFRILVKHRQSVTAVALSEDDSMGFSASKDGIIMHWDINSGKGEKYLWPSEELLRSHGVKDPQGQAKKRSKHVLSLAVSSDGRYLATGGLDRHVHLWDTRTRDHIQAFPGHRGPVSCLTFRQGTTELFSGSFDRTIKIWNAEDRAYINSLFGHQSEVLSIDCLRKERVLAAGRDRTMQLFKVPEESRLVFRAPMSNLECCCFISNDEFLSGSDDGSIELWNVVRKKPVNIIKNAHALSVPTNNFSGSNSHIIANGHAENGDHNLGSNHCSSACSWVSSVSVCRNSDLAASGAGNGFVRLWAIEGETKDIRPLYDLPLVGFVNSLNFAKSGRFLIAGVGQEPRLGRWGRLSDACNGVAIHPLKLS